jgi:hypothetical protein
VIDGWFSVPVTHRPPVCSRTVCAHLRDPPRCQLRIRATASVRPRRDRGEGSARSRFTAVADAPSGLDVAVDADEQPERFGAVPPAEPRSGDDPGVLVEPVALVGPGRAAAGSQPGVEASRTDGEGDLVERLRGGAGDSERGWSGRPERFGPDGASRTRASSRPSTGARRRPGVARTGHTLRRSFLRLVPLASRSLQRPVALRLRRELRPSSRVRGAVVMPSQDRGRRPTESDHDRERGHDRVAADAAARRGSNSPRRSGPRGHRRSRQRWRLRLPRLPYRRRARHRLARVGQLRTRPFGECRIDQR